VGRSPQVPPSPQGGRMPERRHLANRFSKAVLHEMLMDYKQKDGTGRWAMQLKDIAKKYGVGKSAIEKLAHDAGFWRKPSYAKKQGLEARTIRGPRKLPVPEVIVPVVPPGQYQLLLLTMTGEEVLFADNISLVGVVSKIVTLLQKERGG